MKLKPVLAKKIINEVRSVLDESIIVVDQSATVIASTDIKRVSYFHEGAMIAMKNNEKLYITEEMAEELIGVKPGINLPIRLEDEVIGVIGITGKPAIVEPFAEIIRRMTELIIREANYMEKKQWENRGLEAYFSEWIYINKLTDEFREKGAILGVSFDSFYLCILFKVEPVDARPLNSTTFTELMNNWFDSEYDREEHDFLLPWGRDQFLMVKNADQPMDDADLTYKLNRLTKIFLKNYHVKLYAGVGETIELGTITASYQEAKKALNTAGENKQIAFYHSLLLEIVLEEITSETKKEFAKRVLSALQEEPDLLQTLNVYLETNQMLKRTAELLHIHINTLRYRLEQIKKLTNIDPRSSEGLTLFYIALTFHNSSRSTSPDSSQTLL